MKIGPFTITRHKATEKYKAAFRSDGSAKPTRKTFYQGEVSWIERCKHWDKFTDNYSLAKVAPFTIAGLVTAQGVFFKDQTDKVDAETGKKVAYTLATEATERAEKFAREQQVNSKFYETTWRAAKYGGCFWEITWTPTFGFRIPTMQEYIEPAAADDQGNIVLWRQIIHGQLKAEWTSEELILVPWLGVTTQTWPWAPSIFTGLENELEMLSGIEESAKTYSEKQAWPYEVLALGDAENPVSESEYESARSEWRNRKPGEGFTTTVPTEIKPGGTGSAPIRELAVLCELMKDNVQDSVMIAPISKLYNSTEASAKVMVQHIMTVLGQPWQWVLAGYFENYVLKPWLESSGFSRKSCPQTVFESPDVHKKEEGEYWTSLVQAQIQTPEQACEHLGLEYDEKYFVEKKEQEMQLQKQKLEAGANPKAEGDKQAPEQKPEAKEYDEFIVRKRRNLSGH